MTVQQSILTAEMMRTARAIVWIVSLLGGGGFAARGFIDGYVAALDANTLAIQGVVGSIKDLRTDLNGIKDNVNSFKSEVATEFGRLQGAQQEKDRLHRSGIDAEPLPPPHTN